MCIMKKKFYFVSALTICAFILCLSFNAVIEKSKTQNYADAQQTCLRVAYISYGNIHDEPTFNYCCQWDPIYHQYYVVGVETHCVTGGTECVAYYCDVNIPELSCYKHIGNYCDQPEQK